MSHHIDLIITRPELARLASSVDDLSESHHLAGTKRRATWRGVHLDLYVPYQSRLGANLQLRVERLTARTEVVGNYRLLAVPAHTATKVAALLDRPDSQPGRKDRHEILRLLADPSATSVPAVVSEASTRTPDQLVTLVHKAFLFLSGSEELTRQDRARLGRLEASWTKAISSGDGAVAP